MYIDGVIIMSLVVVALMIIMMVYGYRYAKKHIDQDEQQAKQVKSADNPSLSN